MDKNQAPNRYVIDGNDDCGKVVALVEADHVFLFQYEGSPEEPADTIMLTNEQFNQLKDIFNNL